MKLKCKFNPKYDLQATIPGLSVDLEAAIAMQRVESGLITFHNGLENIEDVGSRIKDSFDALESFSMYASMSSTPNNDGYNNE